MRHKTAEI